MRAMRLGLICSLALFATAAFALTPSGRNFDRVIFVLFENTNFQEALDQPFFKKLATEGANFTNFMAETHPSQGNYIALTSGALHGVTDDGRYDLNVNHIADLLEARGLTWRVYAENYPGNCYLGMSNGGYVRKHTPFISYVNIQKNPSRCANIVNADHFEQDAANGTLPHYVFYVPNENNDGHDTGVKYADAWYRQKFGPYFANPNFMNRTLVISTFDENEGVNGNLVYTSLFGPMVKPQSVNTRANHYSLLKLVEDNWSLGNLGKEDVLASAITGIWM